MKARELCSCIISPPSLAKYTSTYILMDTFSPSSSCAYQIAVSNRFFIDPPILLLLYRMTSKIEEMKSADFIRAEQSRPGGRTVCAGQGK